MPFAGYTNFDECVRKNSHKSDPEAYCATIMRKVEGKANEKLRISKEIGKLIDKLIKSLGADEIKQKIKQYVRKKYNEGLEKQEEFFNLNFVQNKDDLNFLLKYVDGVVGNTTDQINKDLRGIMDRSIVDGVDLETVKLRVKEEFSSNKYLNRYKMVVRTEGLRAENQASLTAARQLSFKVKKYLDVVLDDRTSNICKHEDEKYGSKDLAIDLDEEFVVEVDNKTFTNQSPPFHPNCRTVIRFVEVDDDNS